MINNSKFKILILFLVLLSITSCAKHYAPNSQDPYGFFSGIWHGIIFSISLIGCLISWILSLVGVEFLENVQIIGRPNTGFFYYFGFVIALFHLRFVA